MAVIQSLVAKFEKNYNKSKFFFNMYANQYKNILNNEIKLGNISKKDRVLNIGCGGMPFTAIFLSEMTGAEIIAVDHDEEAVKKASEFVSRNNIKNISIICSKGQNINEISFNKALVALQAFPKVDILNNLLKISEKGSRLIFRQPRNIFKGNYDFLDEKTADSFVNQKMITFNKSLLYIVR